MAGGFWNGFGAAFAAIGAVVVLLGLIWLVLTFAPDIVWLTVKRLALAPEYRRDNSAAVVGGARKAWCLRIPMGVRLIVALGGTREEHEAYAGLIKAGRREAAHTNKET